LHSQMRLQAGSWMDTSGEATHAAEPEAEPPSGRQVVEQPEKLSILSLRSSFCLSVLVWLMDLILSLYHGLGIPSSSR